MADMLEDGLAELAAELKLHASREVVISDGPLRATVSATIGRTRFEVEDHGAVRVVWSERDFIFTAADLVLGGVVVRPKRGMQVRETVGSVVKVFEVLSPVGGEVCQFDEYGIACRVHTKQVGVE